MSIRFSVVIPCYNADRWIQQTLESVLQQTIPADEILMIDDGSSDSSLSIISRISETSAIPIHIFHSDRLGPAGARNIGIQAAIGDWIAFLDADDWWKPNHLERIIQAVQNTSDVVYIAAAEHFSINVNRIVSQSSTPFDSLQNGLDHDTYFKLYQKHGILGIIRRSY
jgi:glycosyltransferase involved in cell wall biosynthesis